MAVNDESNGRGEGGGMAAPYVSFATLKNMIERMSREGGVPSQVDRSYLTNLPGSTQSQLIGSLKWLDLVDEDLKPSASLEALVDNEGERQQLIAEMFRAKYPEQLALPPLATQGQLEKTFRDAGLGGSTLRKAVAFFLGGAKFAELPLSPHFKTPRAPAATERRPRKPAAGPTGPTGPTGAESTVHVQQTGRAHHPLIEGLIQELPAPGAAFPQGKQEDWLQLAKVTFRMIYRTEDVRRQDDVDDEPEPGPQED